AGEGGGKDRRAGTDGRTGRCRSTGRIRRARDPVHRELIRGSVPPLPSPQHHCDGLCRAQQKQQRLPKRWPRAMHPMEQRKTEVCYSHFTGGKPAITRPAGGRAHD
uniref:Uncharacterized protein n=1 Tax=Cairina moschata TaxID=8855 RepID=A0A8C3D0J5_CAIMO